MYSTFGFLFSFYSCADMMFALFPHAAKVLERDRGFCKGPRPVYFFDLDHSKSILHDLLARNPRVVVLFRDEYDLAENDSEEKATMSAKELNKMLSKIIPEGILVSNVEVLVVVVHAASVGLCLCMYLFIFYQGHDLTTNVN